MAVLTALPERAIISKLKGTIDFYLWKGVPCARKWPHYNKRTPYPDEKANQDAFAYALHALTLITEPVKQAYRNMAAGTSWTWRDMAVSAYMSGLDISDV